MSGLGRIQHDFQEYLLHSTAGVVDHVVGTDQVPLPTRLRVYSDAYYARLTEALAANFPALAELMGEKDFNRLAAEYIATHDSRFASIRYYGDELAQFLATEPRYRPVPLLADLARWEWTMAAVFDAADADPVEAGALSSKAPGEWATMRLTFHLSVHVLEFAWNARRSGSRSSATRRKARRALQPRCRASACVVAALAAQPEGILPPTGSGRGRRTRDRAVG